MTGLIFTKHVLQRLLERKIRKADIKKTIGYPDKERSGWDDTVIV